MTTAELDALEALANRADATPGPWMLATSRDLAFMAAAREAMPKLIARVRELEGCDNLQCQRYRREPAQ